jgi:hypothetical protein
MQRINSVRIGATAALLCALCAANAQAPAFGLPLPNDSTYLQTMIEYGFNIPKGKKLPERVDIRQHFVQPGNQGPYASCTAWSIGYGIMTYQENKAKGITPDQSKKPAAKDVFSPGFLFTMVKNYAAPDKTKDACYSGVAIAATFTIASRWGNVPASVYGYQGALKGCRDSPSESVMDSALFRKLRTPVKLFHPCPGCPPYYEGPFNPLQWQYHLSRGEPLLIGIYIDDTFFQRGDSAFRAGSKHFVWDRPVAGDGGGHALVCCGYNAADSTFLFYNSFGPKWGNDGYCWINYRTLYKQTQEAYVFNGAYDEEIKPRKLKVEKPREATSTTASGKLAEGRCFGIGGLYAELAEHHGETGCALVRLLDPTTRKVRATLNVHEEVPRSIVIDDQLWTIRFTETSKVSRLFRDNARLTLEVNPAGDESLKQRISRHIDLFRDR